MHYGVLFLAAVLAGSALEWRGWPRFGPYGKVDWLAIPEYLGSDRWLPNLVISASVAAVLCVASFVSRAHERSRSVFGGLARLAGQLATAHGAFVLALGVIWLFCGNAYLGLFSLFMLVPQALAALIVGVILLMESAPSDGVGNEPAAAWRTSTWSVKQQLAGMAVLGLVATVSLYATKSWMDIHDGYIAMRDQRDLRMRMAKEAKQTEAYYSARRQRELITNAEAVADQLASNWKNVAASPATLNGVAHAPPGVLPQGIAFKREAPDLLQVTSHLPNPIEVAVWFTYSLPSGRELVCQFFPVFSRERLSLVAPIIEPGASKIFFLSSPPHPKILGICDAPAAKAALQFSVKYADGTIVFLSDPVFRPAPPPRAESAIQYWR